MQNTTLLTPQLGRRRAELGMSEEVLAKIAGISRGTVRRILSGNGTAHVSQQSFMAVADALGVNVVLQENMEPTQILERQAEKKARQLVGQVQGNMGLESQAVDHAAIEKMVKQTVHQLLAGSKRALWGE